MAAGEYYSCDECGCKVFYDAEVNYDRVGYMRVLCKDCASKLAEATSTAPNAASAEIALDLEHIRMSLEKHPDFDGSLELHRLNAVIARLRT